MIELRKQFTEAGQHDRILDDLTRVRVDRLLKRDDASGAGGVPFGASLRPRRRLELWREGIELGL